MSTEVIVTVAQHGLDTKRVDAKSYLGARWINHPAYQFDPRHSTSPDLYVQAREPYLLGVSSAAHNDRLANPAFHRAESLRQVFSNH